MCGRRIAWSGVLYKGSALFALLVLLLGSWAGNLSPRVDAGSPAPSQGTRPAAAPQNEALAAGWTIESIDMVKELYDGEAGNRAMALDAAGNPHLVYGGAALYYTWSDGSAWHYETVTGSGGHNPSLVLDGAGRPHISYDSVNYAWYDGSAWHIETVDNVGSAEVCSSLALDGAGNPHISYYDSTNHALKYAWSDGISWHIETVDNTAWVGSYNSLALDSAARPRISYYDATDGDLRYATYDGAAWHIQTVDSGEPLLGVGRYTSLALDTNGRPHISYIDYSNRYLKYARYSGGTWQVEVVDDSWEIDYGTSLALDGANLPHISYRNASFKPGYAWYNGSGWILETVDDYGGSFSSLSLDAAGQPHISYWMFDDLKYAYYDGAAWHSETVDSGGYPGMYLSLALDTADRPHVGYCQTTCVWARPGPFCMCDNVKYMYNDGSVWQPRIVDGVVTSRLGAFTSLALDGNNRPSISYYVQYPLYEVRYARDNGLNWQVERVDSVGNRYEYEPPAYTSLALDSAGNPHISYFDDAVWVLNYASYNGAAWITETVDSSAAVGEHNSLRLDSNDRPHIAYYDATNAALKYAYWTGASWQFQVVDSVGSWDWQAAVSLVLDAQDHPHISYYDAVRVALKYAWYDGAAWHLETVNPDGQGGQFSSLALDAAGRPHVSYLNSLNQDLQYAVRSGSNWWVTTVDSDGDVGYYSSLALDSAGNPHVGYCRWGCLLEDSQVGCACQELRYASLSCTAAQTVSVNGPARLPAGASAVYTATYTPPTATLPLFTWDNGTVGPNASYSWTAPGAYTVTVTATTPCSEVSSTLSVEVFCQPLEGVVVQGPGALLVNQDGTFLATPWPITASPPLTFTWDNGVTGPTSIYSWPVTGTQTLTVTGVNACGPAQLGIFQVEIYDRWPYNVYMPTIVKKN